MPVDPRFRQIARAYRVLAERLAAIDHSADRRIARDTVRDRLDGAGAALEGPPSPGIVADSFALETLIATGAHFEIWCVRQRDLGSLHALKTVAAARGSDPVLRAMLLREAALQLSIHDAGIVRAQTVLRLPDGRPGLLMDLVAGPRLSDLASVAPLSGREVLRLAARLCRTLTAIHASGVVHRDVAPGNILVPDRDVDRCLLIDFGLARRIAQPTTDELVASAGTPGFSDAPCGPADPGADYTALGSVLVAVLTDAPADPDRLRALRLAKALRDGRLAELIDDV